MKLGEDLALIEREWAPCWVVDFPMFEELDDGSLTPLHHPFTAPSCSVEAAREKNPAAALSRAYDMVLNGTELGGGSIRIHDQSMQETVFRVLGIGEEEAQEKFGFLGCTTVWLSSSWWVGLRPGPFSNANDGREIDPRSHCLSENPKRRMCHDGRTRRGG